MRCGINASLMLSMVLQGLCDSLACGLLYELIQGKIKPTALTRYKFISATFCFLHDFCAADLKKANNRTRDRETFSKAKTARTRFFNPTQLFSWVIFLYYFFINLE